MIHVHISLKKEKQNKEKTGNTKPRWLKVTSRIRLPTSGSGTRTGMSGAELGAGGPAPGTRPGAGDGVAGGVAALTANRAVSRRAAHALATSAATPGNE